MPRRDEELDREIGARIREAREKKGIAQAALGRKLGRKSSGSMWKYEEGKAGLQPGVLAEIAEELDVSLDWLISGHERVGVDPELSEAEREKLFRHYRATSEERAMWDEHLRVHQHNRITSSYITGFLTGARANRGDMERATDTAVLNASRDVGVEERQGRPAKPELLRRKSRRKT